MRVLGAVLGAATLTTAGLLGTAPLAGAKTFGFELNGTYAVLSNGEWAKSNEVYKPEGVVRQTWQMSSTCSSTAKCTGQVTSDQGWTAPLNYSVERWLVLRDIPNWAPCEAGPLAGTAATGHQMFTFYGVDENGQNTRNTNLLAGRDITKTDSGSCGRNPGLVLEIPLRLTRIS